MQQPSTPAKSPPAQADRFVRPSGCAIAIFLLVASAALAGDLFSKHLVFRSFLDSPNLAEQVELIQRDSPSPLPPQVILQALDMHRPLVGPLRTTISVNPGVVFGWRLPRPLVLIASVVMIAIVAVMLLHTAPGAHLQRAAIALVLAGAMGNLYDRLFSCVQLPGLEPIRYHVRDFIDAGALHYPYVFNVADVWLVVGVAYLLVRSLMPSRKDEPRA